jgi:hypothetical protein
MRFRNTIIFFLLACAQMLSGQTWTISKVVDNTTACPGSSAGYFNPDNDFPAINGPWVVFVDAGDNNNCTANDGPSIWSYNLITNQLVDLVDTSTSIPEGTGDFEGFTQGSVDNLQVRDGLVLFYGYGSGYNQSDNCTGGLYTVPVGGGTIYRVVDYTMALPGEGGSFCGLNTAYGIDGLLGMSLDEGEVVFSAAANPGANDGIWWAPTNVNTTKSDLHLIADFGSTYQTSFPPGCSGDCWVIDEGWAGGNREGTNTAFTGASGNPGPYGLFLNSYKHPILLSNYQLPGDNGVNPGYPDRSSDYVAPVVDGDNIFFIGSDPFYDGTCAGGSFTGIFETTTAGKTASNILNTCDTQPNGDSLTANSFNQLAANEGTAVFQVTDATTGNPALDVSVSGVVSELLTTGDPLPTGASCSGGYEAPGCVYSVSSPGTDGVSGGRAAFAATGGPYWYDVGIYVASLGCASTPSDVTVTLGALTYNSKTGIWSQSATVKNTGKEPISGPVSLVLANLSSGATLTDGNGSTVCFAPAASPYIDFKLPINNQLGGGKSEKMTLEFAAPANAEITFTSEVAGTGAR